MYNTILQQKSTMSSDTPKSVSENILDFIFRQMFRPSLLPKGFFHSLVQNIFCPLENQIRIQHLRIRELNSLKYHRDISSFFRSRGCQSIVRNTYSLLCIQSRWNEIPGAGFLNELQDAQVLPVFVRKRGMAELSKKRVFTLHTGEDWSRERYCLFAWLLNSVNWSSYLGVGVVIVWTLWHTHLYQKVFYLSLMLSLPVCLDKVGLLNRV